MVTIRLSRGGSKKRPFYSVLVADRRRSARGRFIERIGFYNPIAQDDEEKLRIDAARVEHWVGRGAQPSARVRQLFRQLNAPPAESKESVAPAVAEKKPAAAAQDAHVTVTAVTADANEAPEKTQLEAGAN